MSSVWYVTGEVILPKTRGVVFCFLSFWYVPSECSVGGHRTTRPPNFPLLHLTLSDSMWPSPHIQGGVIQSTSPHLHTIHGCYESVFRFCDLTGWGAAAPPDPPALNWGGCRPPRPPSHFLGGGRQPSPLGPSHPRNMRGFAP